MNEVLEQKLAELPSSPGVYLFRGRAGQILYVGKARSLKDRVRSYFHGSRIDSPRLDRLVESIRDLEIVATDTEREALVLENNLIKTHKPRYNVLLRDDKNHPYLKLTVGEDYPRIYIVRRPGTDGAVYSGPYVPASLARKTQNLVHRLFGIRNCNEKLDGHRPRACLQYQIKRCVAPCVESIATREEYLKTVESARLFLEGKNDDLLVSLQNEMYRAAEEERFEEAARLRDTVRTLEDLNTRQKMATVRGEERDIFGYYREGHRAVLQVFSMRSGKVVDRDSFTLDKLEALADEDVLSASLKQYYELGRYLPAEIHVPLDFPDRELVQEWLSGRRESRVEIVVPQRGGKRRMVDLVSRNARIAFELANQEEGRQAADRLQAVRELLDLPDEPARIEAFDVSNIQGSDIVASMVVFERGQPKRSEHRKYKIKTVAGGPDDFASMREVVLRRYRRVLEEGAEQPDLILIDGGKGQLGAAYQSLTELGLSHLPLISIAKKEEVLFQIGRSEPLVLPRSSPALQLMQRIRDEAHRFAVTFHRQRRAVRSFHSKLDDIQGIGPRKRKLLMNRFKSLKRVREASVEELATVVGPRLAERVQRHLVEMTSD
ncbi:MAG TPA: excinuclease ABC subunit UvrC [Vicinamibacteria bacterium]|nr:excinuclease ABC subunit UvrC [Vicinamibacteria bacterium]